MLYSGALVVGLTTLALADGETNKVSEGPVCEVCILSIAGAGGGEAVV